MSQITRSPEARTTTTPNATMTTLASPTLGGTERLSLGRGEMGDGHRGPLHVFDSEQVWTVVAGAATFTVDGRPSRLQRGDTIVLPAGAERQIQAHGPFEEIVSGDGHAVVETGVGRLSGRRRNGLAVGDRALVFVRPEALRLVGDGAPAPIACELSSSAFEGNATHLFTRARQGQPIVVTL